jgi:hypothetical protein
MCRRCFVLSEDLDKLKDWLIEKSEILNDNHWDKIMEAEQDLAQVNDKKRRRNLQNIALKARNDIKKFRSELENLLVLDKNIKLRTQEYLSNWDKSFYFMAKYADSRNIKDFGSATNYYKMINMNLQEILGLLGIGNPPEKQIAAQTPQLAANHHVIREKEIIREKQVIIKVRCRYCKGAYNEELDSCPHCGGTR